MEELGRSSVVLWLTAPPWLTATQTLLGTGSSLFPRQWVPALQPCRSSHTGKRRSDCAHPREDVPALYPWGFTAADGIEPQSWRQSSGWKLSPVLSTLLSQVRTNHLKEQCVPKWSSTQTGLCGLCKRCAHKMPTAQLGTPTQPWSPLLPPACPYSFPQAGESQVPCKAPPDLEEFDQMLLDQTRGEAHCRLVSWTGTRKQAPCCFQSQVHSPLLGNQPILGLDPPGHCPPPLPAAPSGNARAEGTLRLARDTALVPASTGTGRNRARREGKGRRGHLRSISVSRE